MPNPYNFNCLNYKRNIKCFAYLLVVCAMHTDIDFIIFNKMWIILKIINQFYLFLKWEISFVLNFATKILSKNILPT